MDAATVDWITKYFSAGDTWYFLDADGETQGPFAGDVMVSWYKVRGAHGDGDGDGVGALLVANRCDLCCQTHLLCVCCVCVCECLLCFRC